MFRYSDIQMFTVPMVQQEFGGDVAVPPWLPAHPDPSEPAGTAPLGSMEPGFRP